MVSGSVRVQDIRGGSAEAKVEVEVEIQARRMKAEAGMLNKRAIRSEQLDRG